MSNGNKMFKISDLTAPSNDGSALKSVREFNDVFHLQLKRLAPCSINARVTLGFNQPKGEEPMLQAEETKLSSQTNEATRALLCNSTRSKGNKQARLEIASLDKGTEAQLVKTDLKQKPTCPLAPRKRSTTDFFQPSTAQAPRVTMSKQVSQFAKADFSNSDNKMKVGASLRPSAGTLCGAKLANAGRPSKSKHHRNLTEANSLTSDNSYMLALFNMSKAELAAMKKAAEGENRRPGCSDFGF